MRRATSAIESVVAKRPISQVFTIAVAVDVEATEAVAAIWVMNEGIAEVAGAVAVAVAVAIAATVPAASMDGGAEESVFLKPRAAPQAVRFFGVVG